MSSSRNSIIMVGGGIQMLPAIHKLHALNYSVIVTDRNPDAPGFKHADHQVTIDARDVQTLIAWILANKEDLSIKGIFTLTSQAPTVSLVANATGLESLPVNVTMVCDNKLLMKRSFEENDLPSAKAYEVSSVEEVKSIILKYPKPEFYLKAVDGFGGKGIKKIESIEQVESSFNSVKDYSSFPVLLLEEALRGEYIDVQGVFHESVFFKAGSADSYFSNEVEEFKDFNPVETFNVSPSQQPSGTVDDAYALLEEASRKMGMNWGPVGADLVKTKEGLKIIEIGPRLHGPNGTLQIFPAALGINPFEFMIQCIAGGIPDEQLLSPKFNRVALCQVFVSSQENIVEVGFKSNPNTMDGLFAHHIYHGLKTAIPNTLTTLTGLASAFVVGDSYDEAIKNMELVKNEFYIKS